jgi:hypothetical protein
MVRPFLRQGKTLEEEIADNRIFFIDYQYCDGLTCQEVSFILIFFPQFLIFFLGQIRCSTDGPVVSKQRRKTYSNCDSIAPNAKRSLESDLLAIGPAIGLALGQIHRRIS